MIWLALPMQPIRASAARLRSAPVAFVFKGLLGPDPAHIIPPRSVTLKEKANDIDVPSKAYIGTLITGLKPNKFSSRRKDTAPDTTTRAEKM